MGVLRRARGPRYTGALHGVSSHSAKRFDNAEYKDAVCPTFVCSDKETGEFDSQCKLCTAWHFRRECVQASSGTDGLKCTLCCSGGRTKDVPNIQAPPIMLRELLGSSREARQRYNQQFFKDNIRRYNAAMAFASFGDPGGVSAARPSGTGPPVYVLHGQPYHSISTLFPSDGRDPAYGQLYIYDPEEATARRNAWDQGLRKDTLFGLHRMMLNLDGQGLHNPYVLGYKHLH